MNQISTLPLIRLGWEEWVALPGLGLPALTAKVDTGARTSALHAFDIEAFGPASAPHVRFAVHPIPGRTDVTLACSAPILDRREVTSSNGEATMRFVIQTDIQIGPSRCYRVINSLAAEIHYDGARLPHFDAIIPRIGVSVAAYGAAILRQFQARGTFTLNSAEGIVASRDKLHAHQILARHRIGMPTTAFASSPKDTDNLIGLVGGAPLVVKLLESTQGKGVVLAETASAAQSLISAFRNLRANFLVQDFVAEAKGIDIRCFVLDGRVVAAMRRRAAPGEFRSNLHHCGTAEPVRISPAEREAAVRAALAFRLGLAGVDLLRSTDGPKVLEVSASPGFQGVETATGKNLAGLLLDAIERKVSPLPARRKRQAKPDA